MTTKHIGNVYFSPYTDNYFLPIEYDTNDDLYICYRYNEERDNVIKRKISASSFDDCFRLVDNEALTNLLNKLSQKDYAVQFALTVAEGLK